MAISKPFPEIGNVGPSIRRARPLAESLFAAWDDALLFRTLATLRLDVPVFNTIDDLRWPGPASDFGRTSQRLNSSNLFDRAHAAKFKLQS